MSEYDPAPIPEEPAKPAKVPLPTNDDGPPPVPVWLIAIILILCVGGGVFVWWWLKGPTVTPIAVTKSNTPSVPKGTPPPRRVAGGKALPQAQDPGATSIEGGVKDVSPENAVAALNKQTNIAIRPNNDSIWDQVAEKKVSLEPGKHTFWETAVSVAKQSGMGFYTDYSHRTQVMLSTGNANQLIGPSVSSGSFYLVLNRIDHYSNATFVKPVPNHSIYASILLLVEPKIGALDLPNEAFVESAIDDKGNNLVVTPTGRRSYYGQNANWMANVRAQIKYIPDMGATIKILKGYVAVVLTTPGEPAHIKDPLKETNVKKTGEGITFTLKSLKAQGANSYVATFGVDTPYNVQLFSDFNTFSKLMVLTDADGKEFNAGGGGWGGMNNGHQDFTVHYRAEDNSSTPAELTMNVPGAIKEIRIPFEFHDLPIPQ